MVEERDWSNYRGGGPARVALYARVSTIEQERGYSLQEQVREIRRYCDRRGGRCVRLLRESESGGTMERPKLERLLAAAERGEFDAVLVWRVDRISRSNFDLQALWTFFKSIEVALVSATEPFDATTTAGKAFFDMLALMAEMERNTIKERASLGARGRAKDGKWHGGPPPHGYAYDPSTGRLRVDEKEAALVRHIATLALEHRKLEAVARILRNEGVPTRRGLPWSKATLSRLIRNSVYLGVLRVRDIVIQDASLRILDDETFARLQALRQELQRHRIANFHRPPGMVERARWCCRCGEPLYGAMAYCSNCGAAQWVPAGDGPLAEDEPETTQIEEVTP